MRDRFGLFARRFNPTSEVTAVTAGPAALGLRGVRFVPGKGVVARVDLDGTAARLDLFDITGRRVASRTIEGADATEVTLPGTASLSSGLYFARLGSGAHQASRKVAFTR
jgi:hypothetical protein